MVTFETIFSHFGHFPVLIICEFYSFRVVGLARIGEQRLFLGESAIRNRLP